jgi:hypothetical protein
MRPDGATPSAARDRAMELRNRHASAAVPALGAANLAL